jgi:hypothetical protein
MSKSAFASIGCKKGVEKPELPPNARFEKIKSVLKLLVPVVVSVLWSLSNIASYQMGVSAGRAKAVAEDVLKQVAQDAFEQGVDKGYYEGLSRNISSFLPTSGGGE